VSVLLGVAAASTVVAASTAVLAMGWRRRWSAKRIVGMYLMSLLVLWAVSTGVGLWADRALADIYRREAFAELGTMDKWLELAKWGSRTAAGLATLASAFGLLWHRLWWCFPILAVLPFMWVLAFAVGNPSLIVGLALAS
jgi:hypothetical protein